MNGFIFSDAAQLAEQIEVRLHPFPPGKLSNQISGTAGVIS